MKTEKAGFSLVELMITVLVLSVVSGAAISMMYQSQFVYTEQTQAADASQNLQSAMDQVVRIIRQAGSDPLDLVAVPAVSILGEGYIQVASDVTGSVPSTTGNSMESTGDPDGTLSSIGELVTFRFDDDSEQLFMDMGYGEGLLAENISDFSLSYFDLSGSATTVGQDIALVKINMTGKSEDAGMQTGRKNAVSLSSDVFLRSIGLAANTASYTGAGGGTTGGDDDSGDDDDNGNGNGKGNGKKK